LKHLLSVNNAIIAVAGKTIVSMYSGTVENGVAFASLELGPSPTELIAVTL
jgi:hypothetical protein